jgi:muramoyltetrapeptide carboxypeptidase
VGNNRMKIGVVAPSGRLDLSVADQVKTIAATCYPQRPPEIYFHPQCFLSAGHFAGDDAARTAAFVEVANDPSYDALWFARGGYGSCRLLDDALPRLTDAARAKTYLGYSDAGSLMAGLYARGFTKVFHGPMPSEIRRENGEAAVRRALAWLVERDPRALEPTVRAGVKTAVFNMTILGNLLGGPWQPDLSGHVLMLEEVSEYMYAIDRSLFHITSNPGIRQVAGIRLGRCSDIPANDPDFGQDEEQVTRHWCENSGIAYLGRADVGHDADNKVAPFGALPASEV